MRAFSEFYVEYGKDQDGNVTLYRVPVRYADTNRNVSSLIHNNSENTLNTVPIMVVYISALTYDRDRVQHPTYTEQRQVRQRATDPQTGQLTTTQAQAFTLERMMPTPYKLTIKMEVWTTNFDQKLQIYEQILTIFNPALEIQNTDNYLDWTSLSYMLLTDVQWSSRNIPVGTDDPIDVGTLTFEVPIWISPPAKLKKLGVIQQIVDSVYNTAGNLEQAIINQAVLSGNRQYFTPTGYGIIAVNGQVTLINKNGPVINTGDLAIPNGTGKAIDWNTVLSVIGEVVNGVSLMQLRDSATNYTVTGTIAKNPSDPNVLLFNIIQDTVPSNTLPPLDSIIDPQQVGPNVGLPNVVRGQTYLILNKLGSSANNSTNQPAAWKNADGSFTTAVANDIIQYDGAKWNKVFDSTTTNTIQYVTNNFTSVQYKWTGAKWIKSWEGYYDEGFWSIVI